MSAQQKLVTLIAETSIHAGGSTSEGVVDLPIQREQHTGWPCIYGSGMKGAMRAKAEQQALGGDIVTLFGPDPKDSVGSEHAGSLLISDARLLFLPVRSLTGHYRWVTCPAILQRLQRDSLRINHNVRINVPEVGDSDVLVSSLKSQNKLFLEEYAFTPRDTLTDDDLTPLAGMLNDVELKELQGKLAIISNDNFQHLCQAAIPVNAHIALDSTTKTVRKGALWYEESLPADTVMYMTLVAQNSRNKTLQAGDVMGVVSEQLFAKPYLQVGGNETTGMGWFRVNLVAGE